jgi:hypothetical protein
MRGEHLIDLARGVAERCGDWLRIGRRSAQFAEICHRLFGVIVQSS